MGTAKAERFESWKVIHPMKSSKLTLYYTKLKESMLTSNDLHDIQKPVASPRPHDQSENQIFQVRNKASSEVNV